MGPAMFGTLVFVVILIVFLFGHYRGQYQKLSPRPTPLWWSAWARSTPSRGTGLPHVKIPFIDRIAKKVSLKEQVVDFPPQPVITKDNVTMQIDTVVYLPDHRPQALHLRRGAPHGRH